MWTVTTACDSAFDGAQHSSGRLFVTTSVEKQIKGPDNPTYPDFSVAQMAPCPCFPQQVF